MRIPPPLRGEPHYLTPLPLFLSNSANEGRARYLLRFDTPERYQAYMTRYYRLITEVDAAIGRVADELKTQGVYDDTVIILIGDNGYFQADRGLADKWYPYEESVRVPLIVRDPRLPAGRRGETRSQLALNIDVAPTIVAATGLPMPGVMQGQDLAPLYLQARTPHGATSFSTSIRRFLRRPASRRPRPSSGGIGSTSSGRSTTTSNSSICRMIRERCATWPASRRTPGAKRR